MAWLKATYSPVTLFSLKPSWATSTGGKTLLIPSPYAIKMGLLDAVIRTEGVRSGAAHWPLIRDLKIGVELPSSVVVTNLFTKVLKIRRNPAKEGSVDAGPFQKSIGYREYVYLSNHLHLLFELEAEGMEALPTWLAQLSYLGKRGGYIQLMQTEQLDQLTHPHTLLTDEIDSFPLGGVLQQLEDCDPKMKFEAADIYHKTKPKRITRNIVLPYQIKRSSRAYTLYERLD